MSARAAEKKLDLKADYIGSVPDLIHTDPTRVRQILVNLIGNAIKFTSSGSVRVVSQLIVSPDGAPPRLRIDVIDTGIGMRDDQVQNLFHPFTQADMTMSRQYGGTGLGLAISQRLARMLGGDIVVASEYGRGSCFTVTIDPGAVVMSSPPNDGVGESAAPPPRPVAARLLENAHILIVDDAPDNRKLLSYHIKKAGGSFDLAENGEIAVNLIRRARCSRPYDAVLMDMQMPVLDGYQATAAIRNDGDRLPIIALTAHAMTGDREKCLDAGCDDFLTKPIDRVALIETLARYVAKPKAELTVFPL
jgi:CheY-like chemotaxis protein